MIYERASVWDSWGCRNLILRDLCVLCASAVYLLLRILHRRDAEDAEITQRRVSNRDTTGLFGVTYFESLWLHREEIQNQDTPNFVCTLCLVLCTL